MPGLYCFKPFYLFYTAGGKHGEPAKCNNFI